MVVIIDKHITGETVTKFPVSITVAHGLVQLIVLPIILIPFISEISLSFSYVVPLIGGSNLLAVYLYYKVIKTTEASIVTVVLKISPIFVLIMSLILFDSVFTVYEYIGMAMLFISSLIVSDYSRDNKFYISRETIILIISAFLFGFGSILREIALNNGDTPFTIVLWSGITMVILCLPILFKERTRTGINEIFISRRKNSLYYIISGFFEYSGTFLYTISIEEIDVTIASFILAAEPAFVLVIGGIMTLLGSERVSESLDKKNLLIKSFAIILIIIGTWIIY
jgi:drug/metabolite transporter (DMT)-like permease